MLLVGFCGARDHLDCPDLGSGGTSGISRSNLGDSGTVWCWGSNHCWLHGSYLFALSPVLAPRVIFEVNEKDSNGMRCFKDFDLSFLHPAHFISFFCEVGWGGASKGQRDASKFS